VLADELVVETLKVYLTESDHEVVLQKPIPAQIRQVTINFNNNVRQVDGFVREWTFIEQRHSETLKVRPGKLQLYLSECVCKVIFQKSVILQIRQLILYHY